MQHTHPVLTGIAALVLFALAVLAISYLARRGMGRWWWQKDPAPPAPTYPTMPSGTKPPTPK